MLVTLKDLEEKLTSTVILIKSYIDSRFRAHFEADASNVYAVGAEVVEE